ncbi:MAG: glycosyltransferase, partial [Ilumatobacteraceae bacterium]
WIASDGPDTLPLQAEHAADTRISWLGRINDPEKFARLRGASVFCAPSLHGESFGVVLIEAMAAGTAVVASGLDGYRNVATDGLDAVLVPPGDVGALRRALTEVLTNSELAASLRTAGLRRAGDFSMATLAAEYVRIYRQLLADADAADDAARSALRRPRWRR